MLNLAARGKPCGNGLVDIPGTVAVADVMHMLAGTIELGTEIRCGGNTAGEHHQIGGNKLLLPVFINIGNTLFRA